MPSFNRPLVPGFLKRLDNYLLKNKPDLWSTRLHLTIWYSLLATIVVTALYYLANGDAREETFEHTWLPYVMTICSLGLIVYIIYVVRFNVFKRFGNLNIVQHGAMQFICSVVAIASIGLPAVVPQIAEGLWADKQFPKLEVAQDARQINFQYHLIEKTAEEPWKDTEYKVVSDTNDDHLIVWMDSTEYAVKLRQDSIRAGLLSYKYYNPGRAVEEAVALDDTAVTKIKNIKTWRPYAENNSSYADNDIFGNLDVVIHERIKDSIFKQQDSIVTKSNNRFIFYDCPNFQTCNSPFGRMAYGDIVDSALALEPDMKIYYQLKAYKKPINLGAENKKFDMLCSKYLTNSQINSLGEREYQSQQDRNNMKLKEVEDSMDKIADKMKQRILKSIFLLFNIMLISAMCFTILLLIFRHTTQKVFWISALVFMLLFILTALIGVSTRSFKHPDYIAYFYSAVFVLIALSTYSASHRTIFHGIGINIAVILSSCLPLCIFVTHFHNTQEELYSAEALDIYTPEQLALIQQLQTEVDKLKFLLGCMPVISFIICILLFAFVIAPLYKKWYSMPSN
jgi:hypothetical protein